MSARGAAQARPDVALDVRETSHTSAGMRAYVRALRALLPRVAPELRIAEIGRGDNFDLAEQAGIPLALARLRPRLVHFPTPYVPRFVATPHVVTVHDVIDLEFPRYAKRKVQPYWKHVVGPVLRSARAVITDDDATVALLERYLGVDRRRVRVIPLGVDAPDPLPEPLRGERPYFFYAGNHRPHKDLATLVAAWASLPDRHAVDLVLTGAEEPALRGARHTAGELVFAGDVNDDQLWRLHRGALAYVHPALREGFGLPLLEALRAGTPVIAADAATPSVLKPYVRSYPAHDAVALRLQLLRAAEQPDAFAREAERAREATAHLTWERTVRATADVYRALLESRG
ncbi:MAG TPA: glycosyltransferase family 1 protein [Candidatus Elarobacter sp.]|nr:glycosyltransferase family 1 protein [Dongiaceae bacterium]HZW53884.1 glycosyltransferase family 1 protein [Candidatus Elarobacter sp.]